MSHSTDVTVCIPTIPPRKALLTRAINSVLLQTHPAAAISVAIDNRKEGAGATRQQALDAVNTPWVAFLDDDDEFKPEHLERLLKCAQDTGADYVFSYFDTKYCGDPLGVFGKPFDPKKPHQTTITVLVRTELAKSVGFHTDHPEGWEFPGEDWRFTLDCVAAGAHIVHLPERTWYWHWHSTNTSGQPNRW